MAKKKTKRGKRGLAKKTTEKFIPQTLRGMKDILPEEQRHWRFILEKMEKMAKVYDFEKIDPPILEKAVLFEKGVGIATDIVEKEMFTFTDRGGERVCLRPEMTASIARSYIEHGMINLSQPIKLFSYGPLFRHEKPQAGRYRQFYQFNLEVLGSANHIVDSQIIVFSFNLFDDLKLKTDLQINSLGCLECRKEYQKNLLSFYRSKKKLFCSDCQRRVKKNPLRILDCKEKTCQELSAKIPQLVDSLCQLCKDHFIKVLEDLDEMQVPYNLNPRLVRGLDYYTRTVFEFWPTRPEISEEEKKRNSLAGGGRYDGLVEMLGGRPTPACGIAFGLERIIEEMKVQKNFPTEKKKSIVFLAHIGEAAKRKALKLFEDLRKEKIEIRECLAKDSLKSQLELADKMRAKLVLILGQDELVHKTIIIREMETGLQETVDLNKVIKEVKKRLWR